jgi:hypothetical protein
LISFGALFNAFITTFPLGEYGAFCRLLTFGVTFCTWRSFFLQNGCKKVDKNAKNKEKVSRPGLYKQFFFVQERPSIQKVFSSTSCYLLCFYLDTWQAWSNATKRGQEKITFADARSNAPYQPSYRTPYGTMGTMGPSVDHYIVVAIA